MTTTLYKGFFTVVGVPIGPITYEMVLATDSVSLLVYHRTRRQVVLVKQNRPPMACTDNPDGKTIELVAGRFDVDLPPTALMVKEAEEEIGATIKEEDIELLNNGQPLFVSAGMTNEKCYLGYVEIDDSMIIQDERTFGVAEEGEVIERIWMNIEDFLSQACECVRVMTMQQWLKNKLNKDKEI